MTAAYIWPNIRTLLTDGFTEVELRQFCFDWPDFKPLYPQLAQNSSLSDIIQQVLDYAERTAKTEILLTWARDHNPARFEAHQPYHSSGIEPSVTLSQGRYQTAGELAQVSEKSLKTAPAEEVSQLSPGFTYDVFVSCDEVDFTWVVDELLPRLKGTGLRVCFDLSDDFPGMQRLQAVEHAIETSRKTLIVLTPTYLDNEWAELDNLLAQSLDPASRQRRLIPLLIEKCEPPLRLKFLVPVNFVNPIDPDFPWTQLLRALARR